MGASLYKKGVLAKVVRAMNCLPFPRAPLRREPCSWPSLKGRPCWILVYRHYLMMISCFQAGVL